MTFTIGSLFDGSGGFPLAAFLCGGVPVWASEIEPYPIAVTKTRFPYMKHLGDISKINGAEIEPVDVITFGSPCQDLSVAGKRAGLKHEANGDEETTRSGLFMEAVRIIKEMRDATNGKYPRIALWENVPGAFSSNKGEDFRVVLEELIKIVEPGAVMPAVPKKGWAYADNYSGDGWSLAYRVLDAQFWGVPQRRRRIYLVLDLGGGCAGKILFEREGLRGHFEEGRTPWERAAVDAQNRAEADDRAVESTDGGTGRCLDALTPICVATQQGGAEIRTDDKAPTVTAAAGMSGNNQPWVALPYTLKIRSGCEGGGKGALIQKDKSATLATNNDQYLFQPITYDARGNGDGKTVSTITGDHENRITDYTSVVVEHVYCLQGNGIDRADTAGCNGKGWKENTSYTLNTIDRPAMCYATDVGFFNTLEEQSPTLLARGYKDPHLVTYPEGDYRYIVRRLTPTECARLQGFPDRWGNIEPKEDFTEEEYQFWLDVRNTHATINGKQIKDYTKNQMLTWYNRLHTDSSEYKLWGNGIALPTALYCMQGISEALKQ